MLNVTLPYPKPFRALYVIAVSVTALVLFGVLWFGYVASMTAIDTAIGSSMNQYDLPNTSYQSWEYATIFMRNLADYLLVIMLFGLFIWVIVYQQRKRAGFD